MLNESDLKPSQLVQHSEWGTGELRSAEPGSGQVVIDFAGRPGHSMNRELALRALSPVVGEGLRAIAWKSPELLAAWIKAAPLRLVVAALRDVDGQCRPEQLRNLLESRVASQLAWSTWWSRTRQLIRSSAEIQITRSGVIRLASRETLPGGLREIPLPGAPKKSAKAKTESGTELYEKLKSGHTGLGTMTTEELRKVCRQIVTNEDWGCLTDARSDGLWSGQVNGVEAVLEFLAGESRTGDLIRAFGRIAASISRAAKETAEGNAHSEQWVVKRSEILAGRTRELRIDHSFHWRSPEVVETFTSLAETWSALNDLASRMWALAAAGSVASALKSLVALDSQSAYVFGSVLCDLKLHMSARDQIARTLLDGSARVDASHHSWQLLGACPDLFIGSFWNLVAPSPRGSKQLLEDLQGTVESLVSADLRRSAVAAAVILKRMTADLPPGGAVNAAVLGLAIAALDARAADTLGSLLEDLIYKALSRTTAGAELPAHLLTILKAAEHFAESRIELERARTRANEREATALRKRIGHMEDELRRTSSLVSELKSDLGEPERLAEYHGQRRVLDEVGACYSDFAMRAVDAPDSCLVGVLARLEQAWQRFGARKISTVGEIAVFDPVIHQYFPSDPQSGSQVEVVFPGYAVLDPAGRSNVIVRAVVKSR